MDHMYIYIRFSRISIKDKYRGNLCRFSQVKSVMKKIPFWEILYALVPGKLHFFLSREITRIPRFAWSSGKSTNLSRLVLKISPLSELCRWSYKVIFHFSVFIQYKLLSKTAVFNSESNLAVGRALKSKKPHGYLKNLISHGIKISLFTKNSNRFKLFSLFSQIRSQQYLQYLSFISASKNLQIFFQRNCKTFPSRNAIIT